MHLNYVDGTLGPTTTSHSCYHYTSNDTELSAYDQDDDTDTSPLVRAQMRLADGLPITPLDPSPWTPGRAIALDDPARFLQQPKSLRKSQRSTVRNSAMALGYFTVNHDN